MKQKVVIRVSMGNRKKGRTKALKIVVSHPGVESVGLVGSEKDQIQVIGEGIDAVKITSLLRKNVGPSEILSVGPVEQKKVEQKNTDKVEGKNTNKVIMTPTPVFRYEYEYNPSHYPIYDVVPYDETSCSIM